MINYSTIARSILFRFIINWTRRVNSFDHGRCMPCSIQEIDRYHITTLEMFVFPRLSIQDFYEHSILLIAETSTFQLSYIVVWDDFIYPLMYWAVVQTKYVSLNWDIRTENMNTIRMYWLHLHIRTITECGWWARHGWEHTKRKRTHIDWKEDRFYHDSELEDIKNPGSNNIVYNKQQIK